MDKLLERIWAYFWLPETKFIIAGAVILSLLSLRLLARERRRVGGTFVVFVLCLLGQLFGAILEGLDYSRLAVMLHELFVIGSGMALFRLAAIFAFRAILPRVGIVVPADTEANGLEARLLTSEEILATPVSADPCGQPEGYGVRAVKGAGQGRQGHRALYRYFRKQGFDIVDCRNADLPTLIIALLAGVPHRIGPVPKGRVQHVMARAGLWSSWQPTLNSDLEGRASELIARYLALHRGAYCDVRGEIEKKSGSAAGRQF